MRSLFIVALLICASACTKKNPDLCCTTQADCDSVGIPVGSGCDDGLVCRGNQCIAETCSSSADCDAAAPFCDGQSCLETCSMDSECPGFAEDTSQVFCESGACVACRMGMNDCPAGKPICDMGACRACIADGDCASDVCDIATGTCRDAVSVLYASPTGGATAACTQADPCTIQAALSHVTATQDLIRLGDGTYHEDLTFPAGIKVTVLGGSTEVTGVSASNLINVGANSNITFRNGKYTAVTPPMAATQHVFLCLATAAQPASLTFQGVTTNRGSPSTSNNCKLTLQRSTFGAITGENGGSVAMDQSTMLDGLSFLSDANNLQLDIKNSIFYTGIQFPGSAIVSGTVAFSTFVMQLYASCSGHVLFENNIFFSTNIAGVGYAIQHSAACTSTFDHNLEYPQDVPIGTNVVIGDPKLKDVPGNDFHLLINSAAIDAADPAATDGYDFDGTARPQGAGRDVGAFEFH